MPTRDFGNFIDHFDTFTTNGVANISFKAIAKSLFGIKDFKLGKALSDFHQSYVTGNKIYLFPLPAQMASLLTPTVTTFNKDKVVGGSTFYRVSQS